MDHLTIEFLIRLVLTMALYCAANRIAGDGVWFRKYELRGRPVYYAAVGAAILGIPLLGLVGSVVAAGSFLLWRTFGWKQAIDAGTTDGRTLRDAIVLTFISLFLFPIFLLTWNPLKLVLCAMCVAASYHYVFHYTKTPAGQHIPLAEKIAGAAVGFWFFMAAQS